MSVSLRAKLIAATLSSVVTIAFLVVAINYGSSELVSKLGQSQIATVALRNHTNADMMHDAVRADVYAAFHYAREDRSQRNAVANSLHEHTVELRRLIAANEALALPGEVKARNQPSSDGNIE